MDLFRRKQKLIFWIVTLIIVPSFVLVWGVGDIGGGPDNSMAGYEMGKVDGKSITFQEYESFRKRIGAALGGEPYRFVGVPGFNTQSEDLWKYVFTLALLRDAEKAGIGASDLQVGTYIRNYHPTLKAHKGNEQALDRAVASLCAQMEITRTDFLRGVREWLAIGNYLDADANLAATNATTAFAFYSLNQAECVVKRVRVLETDAIREQAKKDVTEKPAEELERAVREYVAQHSTDRRYRNSSGWRFAWLFTPFATESAVREPSEDEINDYYEQMKRTLYNGQPLEEVRDQVLQALNRINRERQVLRNFNFDIDPQIRSQAKLDPAELVKLTPLAKYGVTAGDTGAEPLSPAEVIAKLPEGAAGALAAALEDLDDRAVPAERDALIAQWKEGYLPDHALFREPFRADNGYFRLRLVDYRPSTPIDINDADGNIKPEILEIAVADMIGERAAGIVEERAAEMERKLYALIDARDKGGEIPDADIAESFDALPTETIAYMNLNNADFALGRLEVGGLLGPLPFTDGAQSGQEIIALVGRRVPDRAAFDALPEQDRNYYLQQTANAFRGGMTYDFSLGFPILTIQPSPTAMGAIAHRFNQGQILVNPELLDTPNEG